MQPKQINEIKDFLLTARRKDARSVKIKKTNGQTKFKVRCSKYLYTLVVSDGDKAEKLKQSLPPGERPGLAGLERVGGTGRGHAGRDGGAWSCGGDVGGVACAGLAVWDGAVWGGGCAAQPGLLLVLLELLGCGTVSVSGCGEGGHIARWWVVRKECTLRVGWTGDGVVGLRTELRAG